MAKHLFRITIVSGTSRSCKHVIACDAIRALKIVGDTDDNKRPNFGVYKKVIIDLAIEQGVNISLILHTIKLIILKNPIPSELKEHSEDIKKLKKSIEKSANWIEALDKLVNQKNSNITYDKFIIFNDSNFKIFRIHYR